MPDDIKGGILQALMQPKPQPQSGGILGDNWSRLAEAGGTIEPTRAPTGTMFDLFKLLTAMNGGTPVTTGDLVRLTSSEAGFPAQALRDIMNLFTGKPAQLPGKTMVEYDPYNPFQGGS